MTDINIEGKKLRAQYIEAYQSFMKGRMSWENYTEIREKWQAWVKINITTMRSKTFRQIEKDLKQKYGNKYSAN